MLYYTSFIIFNFLKINIKTGKVFFPFIFVANDRTHHIQMIIMFKYFYMDMLFFASHATKFRHSMRNKALYMYYLKSIKYILRNLTEGLVWMISYCYVLFIRK